MDAITDPDVERVTLMKSARIGYTKIIGYTLGYYIEHDPSPVLIVQPTIEDAQGYSKDEIAPLIRDTPVLDELVADVKSRDSSNTILHKVYPGGALHIIGANSPRGFRRLTKRVVLFDEVDGYPLTAGQEGDQIQLGIKRTETYENRKIVLGSSPTVKGASRIDRSYEQSDRRVFLVPCPQCKAPQEITWGSIRWPQGNPERAYMECSACGFEIDPRAKASMLDEALVLEGCGWHGRKPFLGHAGFHIWAGYSLSPNAAWGKLATEFLEVKSQREELKTFTNQVLGQTWEVEGDRPDHDILYRTRREHFDALPAKALVLTAGVDVQKDRLEMEVVAWARDLENWSVRYEVLHGDPSRQQVWDDLTAALDETYDHENGSKVKVSSACVDSGGLHTDQVYAYCKTMMHARVWPIKGRGGMGLPVVINASRKNRHKVRLFTLGVDTIKGNVYSRLATAAPAPGYCHFPWHYEEKYFLGLASEKAITKYVRGQATVVWVHDSGVPNEPLDCRVYAEAAREILRPKWAAFEAHLALVDDDVEEEITPPQPAARKIRRNPRAGGWVRSW